VQQNKKAGQKHSGYLLRQHLLPYFGHQKIQNIEHQQVQEFFDLKSKQLIKVPGRGEVRYSSATLSQVRTEMSLIMKAAKVDKAYFGENPCLGVRLPKAQPVLKLTALSPDQASRLLAALPTGADGVSQPAREMSMLSILLAVGEAELLGLQHKNLNLTDQHNYETGLPPYTIRIERNYYLGTFDSVKCARRSRTLSLCPELVEALKSYVERQKWAEPYDVLFCGPKRGIPIQARNVKVRVIQPICEKLGIPKFSFHTGRRSFASISETMPDFTRTEQMQVLGHASASMSQHYSHAEWERVKNGAAAMGKRIFGVKQHNNGQANNGHPSDGVQNGPAAGVSAADTAQEGRP